MLFWLKSIVRRSRLYRWYSVFKWRKAAIRIVGRHACLGEAVFSRFEGVAKLNHQKNRIDLVMEKPDRLLASSYYYLLKCLRERTIVSCAGKQKDSLLDFIVESNFVLIDSFSELADQHFLYKGESFYCCYSDISEPVKHSPDLVSKGLLNADLVLDYYRSFVEYCIKVNPTIKIIYLHFPVVKENRDKFLSRAKELSQVCETLSYDYPQTFINVELDSALCMSLNQNDEDSFAYHYSEHIYDEFANKIRRRLPELKLG